MPATIDSVAASTTSGWSMGRPDSVIGTFFAPSSPLNARYPAAPNASATTTAAAIQSHSRDREFRRTSGGRPGWFGQAPPGSSVAGGPGCHGAPGSPPAGVRPGGGAQPPGGVTQSSGAGTQASGPGTQASGPAPGGSAVASGTGGAAAAHCGSGNAVAATGGAGCGGPGSDLGGGAGTA